MPSPAFLPPSALTLDLARRPSLTQRRPRHPSTTASLPSPTPSSASSSSPLPTTSPVPSSTSSPSPLYDVGVVGAGPAGLALAAALGERGAAVCLFDPFLGRPWPNHYGVWRDEFEAVGLADCAATEYSTTAVCVGGSDAKTVIDRPYLRVDRVKLKNRLMERCVGSGVRVEEKAVREVVEVGPGKSLMLVGEEDDVCVRIVVDCTGHALRFTRGMEDQKYVKPMEQAAYGIEADVVSHPYQVDQMLLMDFRDDHMQGDAGDSASSAERPTFLYVFPSSPTRAFFEETSVIAPTAVSFDELKRRLYKRLAHDGVVVTNVVEEEFSLIPMGGTVPDPSQRVVAFGGAACLVHPATGYMVARTLRLAADTADVIVHGLATAGHDGPVGLVSTAVWSHVWSVSERRQRDFLNFGAELLGSLGARDSRGFFDAFFRLPEDMWSDFLSAEMDEPQQRIFFALYFFGLADNDIRIKLLTAMWTIGRWKLIRSCLPLALAGAKDE